MKILKISQLQIQGLEEPVKNSELIKENLLKTKYAYALINGPISKKYFLKKKHLGITEYLSLKTKVSYQTAYQLPAKQFQLCTAPLPYNQGFLRQLLLHRYLLCHQLD